MSGITSLQNERVKALVRWQEKATERRAAGVIVIEGRKEIELALGAGVIVKEVFYCPEVATSGSPRFGGAVPLREVTRSVFAKIAYRDDSDGVVVIAEAPRRRLSEVGPLPANPIVVVLDGVEKPGNLGAILRTADAAGVDLVIVSDPRCDLFGPNVIRASVGTVFTSWAVTCEAVEAKAWLRGRGLKVAAVTPDAALDFWSSEASALAGPIALCLGTEHEGLSAEWRVGADLAVRIPMAGANDSLNVSVATALVTFEARRRRRA